MHFISRFLASSIAATAMCSAAAGQVEIRLAWRVAGATAEVPVPPVPELGWSTTPSLPAAAVEDLTDIKAAVAAIPIADKAALVSDNGRAIAVFRGRSGPDPQVAPGVTVWMDWRDVDSTILFDDMATARFVSNNHVLLSHHPDGGPYVTFVVDLRRPTTRFQFSGYSLDTLRVTDSGKWAAITLNGVMCSGQLDPSSPTQSVAGTAIPSASGAKNSIWLKDGRFLLVEKDGPTLHVLNSRTWETLSSLPGALGPSRSEVNAAGRDACIGYQPGVGAAVFEVSATGQLSVTRWPYQNDGESTVRVSPNRKFAITQKQSPEGFVPRYCRRTGDATVTDQPPAYPAVPPRTTMQDIGWLYWQP